MDGHGSHTKRGQDRKNLNKLDYISKQVKQLNQKIPSFISESRLQSSLKQLGQTFGDKISSNSNVLEHVEVENLRGSLDITYLRAKFDRKRMLMNLYLSPLYIDALSLDETGNCRFERQLLKRLLPETGCS